jgi:hypothetical protein
MTAYIRLKKHESLVTFFNRIPKIIDNNGCWIALSTNHGYGMVQVRGDRIYLHRLSAHIYLGLDLKDKDIQVNHKTTCKSTRCFNPEHIYVGSQAENVDDMITLHTHRNSSKIVCPRCDGPYTTGSNGRRYCRVCTTDRIRKRRWQKILTSTN